MTADDWSSICKILTSIDAAFRHPERSAEFCQQALGEARRLHNAASLSVAGDDVERLREKLIAFVQQPKWRDDAAEPEDNPDWRSGYEAALSNLREELKPWWPFGGPLRLTALQVTAQSKQEGEG